MESFTLQSSTKRFPRKAWYLPSTHPRPKRIAIFLDAEIYLDRMAAAELIPDLEADGSIEPMSCLFISHQDAEARHHDYTCSDPYADFIAKDVMRWMQQHSGIFSPGNHLIAGVSLSGLQAVYTSLSYPQIFSRTLSQSGSFWWENEWFRKHLRELLPNPGKYWLSVGTKEQGAGHIHPPTGLLQEIDQDTAIKNFSEALKQHGSQIKNHTYEGGHDPHHWQAELPEALRWLSAK
jgi:enterochelin esterase family protein